ncbi:MAG: tryptophan synthase subunit alpha [Ginsengibacter sp.]
MSRLKNLFKNKTSNILNVYCTAGFPQIDSLGTVIEALQENGADIIEVGMPYSDPIADGPVIQQSNAIALHNGISIKKILQQLTDIKNDVTVPLILMGYLNPVLQYGFEKFCSDAKDCNVDGLILPDLPIHEFETLYQPILSEYKLDFIFLITPETPDKRIKTIDKLSAGFIYAVSSSSTTGQDIDVNHQEKYFKRLQGLRLKNPVLVGFGIKDKQTFSAACQFSNGAIIGSAYIKALQNGNDVKLATKNFLNEILN